MYVCNKWKKNKKYHFVRTIEYPKIIDTETNYFIKHFGPRWFVINLSLKTSYANSKLIFPLFWWIYNQMYHILWYSNEVPSCLYFLYVQRAYDYPVLRQKMCPLLVVFFVFFCHMMSSSTFNNITPKSNKAHYYISSVNITTMKRYIYQ